SGLGAAGPCGQLSVGLGRLRGLPTLSLTRSSLKFWIRHFAGGQTVCRGGTQRPCYKIVYFHDASRRISFAEAHEACRRDGGHLVSIESEAEQRLIEKFIEGLLASDGDFWIGLRRKGEDVDNSTDCQDLYAWSDGSSSGFRNWYEDEPSCGSEICVVMYHQPSAPPGVGGPYMFQWNDDRCNVKNNFICKYPLDKPTSAPEEDSHVGSLKPTSPEEPIKEETHVKGRQHVQWLVVPSPCRHACSFH
uniref:Layilin n=1 Tax=Crocodylus porosus TaxID=8502 RepID=A0A7M4E883_CROPO